MGIRQSIQGNPKVGAIAAGLITLTAAFLIFTEARSMGSGGGPNQYYYSIDGGKSYFSDSMSRMPPYSTGGAIAVRVHVFKVNGTPTVIYLSRYSKRSLDALTEAMEARAANRTPAHPEVLAAMGSSGTEIKKPGDSKWISSTDAKAYAITRPLMNQVEIEP